jgi:hypothetical protein
MIHEPPVRESPSAETDMNSITLRSYLRSMWTLFRTAFTEPRTTTVVDLTTGRVVQDASHADNQPTQGTL